jgi:hypothetical protein
MFLKYRRIISSAFRIISFPSAGMDDSLAKDKNFLETSRDMRKKASTGKTTRIKTEKITQKLPINENT